ncbi:BTAD domain-containing putative transcriptional regulator [Occultella gossypii]|uniref:AAA family ATPase n=1 Tax=Occultella gossypii TaxID=2800820 RepID=A0ABS7S6I9_9MICO|nr:BTAD domain-containing putative transcriptional regulator [Occultella gossypii]MBZ2194798.1 AAA family ATPase [Occultella gossypii]
MEAVRQTSGARSAAHQAARPIVRISILGRLTVTIDDVDMTPRGRTQQRLIATLAIAARRDVRLPLSELVDEVYRDHLPPKPRRSLATLVWRLRKKWGGHAIESDQYGYWLARDGCTVDVEEFEALLQRGSALSRGGDQPGAITALTQALTMWRSPEEPERFLPAAQADRLTELHLGAMERLGELLAATGRQHEAVEMLQRVAAERPDWEHTQALLIRSHTELGNLADAHRVCDRARRALIDQGIEPGPELSSAISGLDGAPVPAGPSRRRAADRVVTPDDLIGRTEPLAALVESAGAALRDGKPTVLAITGEAGIGKSTLAGAVVASLTAGERPVATVTLRCDPRRTLPYAAFAPLVPAGHSASALARLLLGEADADPAASVDLLHTELISRLRSLAEPDGLALVVEDLHWAPAATTDAIAALLELADDLPLAVIVTSRRRRLPEVLTPWVERRTRLQGLGVADVAELLGCSADDDRAVTTRRLTGGNPLYVRQLQQSAHTGSDERPDDLTAAIDAHLRIVPGEVVQALRIAAAVGDSFSLTTLVALAEESRRDLPTWRDHLTEAVHHGLIREGRATAGSYDFVHTLIREHLYGQLPAEQQTRIHAAIGRALRRHGLNRPCPPDLLAHHDTRGWPIAPTSEVVDTLSAAGQAAAAQLDFAQAASHYRTGLDYLAMDGPPEPDERSARLLGLAAEASAAAGQIKAANELYESLLHLARTSGWTRWRMFAALGALRTQYTRRVGVEVTGNLADAVAQACVDGTIAKAPDLAGEALAAIQVYRPARAVELLDSATDAEPDLSGRLRMAIWEHQDVTDQLATARRLVTDATADPVGAWLRLWVSEVASGLRAMDDQPPCSAPINDASDRTRFDLSQWRIATSIATGRLERARRLIEEALAAPRHPEPSENAHRAASLYGQLTYLALVSNDFHAAQRSPLVANPTWANRHPIMRYVRAYMQTLAGSLDAAREQCDDLLDEVRDEAIPDSDIVPRLLLLGRACVRSGHQRGLEPCLEHLLRHRGEHGIFRFGQYWGPVDAVIGRLQVTLGDLDAGIESLRAATAGAEAVHAELELPWIRQSLADAVARRGGPTVPADAQPRHTA